MDLSFLSGLGAAMQAGGENTIDFLTKKRARDAAIAQFQAQMGETTRHNTSMEALQGAENQLGTQRLSFDTQNMGHLRHRQDVADFSASAGRGGVNYLDPEQAWQMSQQSPQGIDMPGTPDMGTAVNALRQAGTRQWQRNINPTAERLSQQNVGSAMIPGSEAIGGAVLENKTFNPYADNSWRQNANAASQESMDFSRAQDDIRAQGDAAARQAQQTANEIEKITDMSVIAQKMMQAKEQASRNAARTWSMYLRSTYPNKAHIFSAEALLGEAAPPPQQAPGPPTQAPGNRFIAPGAQQQIPAQQAPAPQATQPQRNRFIP